MSGDGNSSILMALGRQDAGLALERMDDALSQVLHAVMQTGKAGSLTITLKVTPNGGQAVKMSMDYKAVTPKLANAEAFYFVTPDNTLSRDAPKTELPNLFAQNRS